MGSKLPPKPWSEYGPVAFTSTLSFVSLREKINALGFAVTAEEIISTPKAALLYLERQLDAICRLLLADDVKRDLQQFRLSNRFG